MRKTYNKPKYKRPHMQIEILLNPKKLISDKHIKITKDKDIIPISNKFNELIKKIDNNLPDFFYWTLKRIDYATYIITPYVKEYIELFQRGDKPSSRYYIEQYDNKNNRRGQKEGSFYLYSKGTTINFYDKEKERRDNKEKYNISDAEILAAENTLRFEIQCDKSKTDYMKYYYKFETKSIFYYLTLKESRKQILKYTKKVIRDGTYYKLNDAKKIIDNDKDLSTRSKNTLKGVLDLVNKCRSITKAREEFTGAKTTFNNHLKNLDKLGINPVTIPERWNVKFLNNPIEEIKRNMVNPLELEEEE